MEVGQDNEAAPNIAQLGAEAALSQLLEEVKRLRAQQEAFQEASCAALEAQVHASLVLASFIPGLIFLGCIIPVQHTCCH